MNMILKTKNLCKSFNGQTAVNNISLNIERNSVYGLLGPNGAGKSTKASHFQTLLAVPNRHKNMLAKLTYLYGSGVFALFFLFLLFVIVG